MESELAKDIQDLMWMARRYVKGRQTYAPELYANIENRMKSRGVEPPFPDSDVIDKAD